MITESVHVTSVKTSESEVENFENKINNKTYIALNFSKDSRSRTVYYGINFFNDIKIGFIVGVFDSSSPPRHI